jgi:hypothetical protein
MPRSPARTAAIGYVASATVMSVCAGMFFVQGLENVLRGNPSFWIQWTAAPGFLAVAFFLYRKDVRATVTE